MPDLDDDAQGGDRDTAQARGAGHRGSHCGLVFIGRNASKHELYEHGYGDADGVGVNCPFPDLG